MSAKRMKINEPHARSLAEMPEVRDWSRAKRNPYARGERARILDPDLAKAFPDSDSVNAALRALLSLQSLIARKTIKRSRAA